MVSIGTCLAIHSNVHTVAVGSAIFVSKGTTFLSAVTVASSAKSTSVSTSSAPMDFSAVDVMADLIKLHVNALHVRHYLLYESCCEELLRGIYWLRYDRGLRDRKGGWLCRELGGLRSPDSLE